MFALAALGLKISVAGRHDSAFGAGIASDLGWLMESDRAVQDVETMDIGVQVQNGRMEPVARRQSLQ